jgi:uncharacterized protein (TIGR02246 family)
VDRRLLVDDDEHKIRDLLDVWWQATRADDVDTVLELMADDVVFLTPGQEPFGKAAFEQSARNRSIRVDGKSTIQELEIVDGWAWMRTNIQVTMTPSTGVAHHRAGATLTILRKQRDGRWVIARDANLLSG